MLQRYYAIHPGYAGLQRGLDEGKVLSAKLLVNEIHRKGIVNDLSEVEFRVFSQFGEDGIIQYLIHHVPIAEKTFIEFGVGKYSEANTRFLLSNDNWTGFIMDGDPHYVDYIINDAFYWRNDLNAVCAFIDRDNINELLRQNRPSEQVGILSIDLDGNDYWIWETISVVDAAIVIVEYNSVFGRDRAVTVPYDPSFDRYTAHFSGLYWGASLKAFCVLAERKGYSLVGSNSAGNNAFFVRNDLVGELKVHTPQSGYVESKFRDSRDPKRKLNFLRGLERLREIQRMVVFDVEKNEKIELSEILQASGGS